MVGYGLQQLDGPEGSVGNGARVFGAEVRGLTEEHEGSTAQVRPGRPRRRYPETEQRAARRVVAGSIIGPAAVCCLSQAEPAPAKMSPLEKAQGDLSQEGGVRVRGQPGRDGEQPPGVMGAVAAFRPGRSSLACSKIPTASDNRARWRRLGSGATVSITPLPSLAGPPR